MVRISRTCLALILVLSLVGCSYSPPQNHSLEKFNDYVSFYDFLYGSSPSGNFQQLIKHFYNTFYPDNEMNVEVSVFQMSGISETVSSELSSFRESIDKEPSYGALDERSLDIHDDIHQVFTNMIKLSELVDASVDNTQEKEALYKETDQLIVRLSRELGLWRGELRDLQTQHELARLQSFDSTSEQLSFMLLDSIMRSESLLSDMDTLLKQGETDFVRVEENTHRLKEYMTPMLNYTKDAKQLISSGLASHEVESFLEYLTSLTELSEEVIHQQAIDQVKRNALDAAFQAMLALYNKS